MPVNQYRDSILNALYSHFGGNRIEYLLLHDYLCNERGIDGHAVHELLDDLTNSGHILRIPTMPTPEYKISPKGEELLGLGGFVEIQNHLERERESVKKKLIQQDTIPAITINISSPQVNSQGWFNKFKSWCINSINNIIMGIIGSIIASFIIAFWVSHDKPTVEKSNKVDTVKKH